jgi:hypothetical protein
LRPCAKNVTGFTKASIALIAAAGVFSDQVLAGLDWLLVEAGKRGLTLMMTLTNLQPPH